MLKISVKGSADGGWNLTQSAQSGLSTASRANCHDTADLWLAGHKTGTAICLVQLKDVADDALPRAYLAWPLEIAAKLKAASGAVATRSCGKITRTAPTLPDRERWSTCSANGR